MAAIGKVTTMFRFLSVVLIALVGIAEADERPNVLLILADDMGYSDAGCYGSEINTPNLDALANEGLRFSQFYSTGRCWPSRATLMTGYYPQQVQRDFVGKIKRGTRPEWAPMLPTLLKPLGYKNYHSGKWHLDGKPEQNGWDRSWGSKEHHGADDDRFFATPGFKEDDIERKVAEGEEYYSTIALADHAIACLELHERNHKDQPFFQYLAFYSPHFPLHALQEDIDEYREAYDMGWDKVREARHSRMTNMGLVNTALSSREESIIPRWNLGEEELQQRIDPGEAGRAVAWDSLSKEQKVFQAEKMAIHAAMISRMDKAIGRVVEQLKKMDEFDNTLIVFVSDNGASAEQIIRGDLHDKTVPLGSAASYACLGPGWSTAANTPFKLQKHWNHEGGISSPMIAHWPKGIQARGELRHDVGHFIDIAPTVLSLAGGTWPTKTASGKSVPEAPGVSLLESFKKDQDKERTIWWFHTGNRALRKGDWKIAAKSLPKNESDAWELYDLSTDRAEMHNLAKERLEQVKALESEWQAITDAFHRNLDLNKKK